MRNALLILLAVCFGAACGNKGPLYHPSSKPPAKTSAKPAEPAAEPDEQRRAQ